MVVLPLVGCVPLHPPAAEQVFALVAFHCKVVGVPATTVLLVATREMAGFSTPAAAAAASVEVVRAEDDSPHAANADNAANPVPQRNRREIVTIREAWHFFENWMACSAIEANSNQGWGLRPTILVMRFPHKSQLAMTAACFPTASHNVFCAGIIQRISTDANLSQFANVSVICGNVVAICGGKKYKGVLMTSAANRRH